jgi:hypothetical protein
MPSGDAQRAWFPEMLLKLEQFWSPHVSWDEVIAFCARMTTVRTEIRQANGIKSPKFTCRACGGTHRAELLPISPRSALFALRKLSTISDQEMKLLDRAWAKYRKQNDLDAYGITAKARTPQDTSCGTQTSKQPSKNPL